MATDIDPHFVGTQSGIWVGQIKHHHAVLLVWLKRYVSCRCDLKRFVTW